MQLEEYQDRFETIHFARSAAGVLEMRIHTRGGPAVWGVSEQGLHNELGLAFAALASDCSNKILLLTGTGDSFVEAMDKEAPPPEKNSADLWARIRREGVALLDRFMAVPIPVVVAVNGPALIHAELAVLGDIVLASETACFADIAHIPGGIVPGDGVQTVWPMLLGPNRGRYFLLTGQRIDAEEALRLGIVGEVLPPEKLLPRAHEIAARLADLPEMTLRHTRTLLVRDLRRRLADELEMGLALESLAAMR